jgi:hypothetical protein
LRFLGTTLGGWVLLRVGLLWPTLDAPRDLIQLLAPPAAAAGRAQAEAPAASVLPGKPAVDLPAMPAPRPPMPSRNGENSGAVRSWSTGHDRSSQEPAPIEQAGVIAPPLRPLPAHPERRLSASLWAIARDGQAQGLPGGQLGGSQAGVRIAYALGAARRFALAARISTPLQGRGREAAAGIEFRPPNLPLRVIAEQRVALDGGRGGQALYAVGGTAPVPIAAGFRLEAYAQAGVVVRGRAAGFADGAARVARPVISRETLTVDLGIGAWGGVQPGTARVDLGPTLGVALPVAQRRVRLSIDWRQRIAGRARPGSGPALSIGSDF